MLESKRKWARKKRLADKMATDPPADVDLDTIHTPTALARTFPRREDDRDKDEIARRLQAMRETAKAAMSKPEEAGEEETSIMATPPRLAGPLSLGLPPPQIAYPRVHPPPFLPVCSPSDEALEELHRDKHAMLARMHGKAAPPEGPTPAPAPSTSAPRAGDPDDETADAATQLLALAEASPMPNRTPVRPTCMSFLSLVHAHGAVLTPCPSASVVKRLRQTPARTSARTSARAEPTPSYVRYGQPFPTPPLTAPRWGLAGHTHEEEQGCSSLRASLPSPMGGWTPLRASGRLSATRGEPLKEQDSPRRDFEPGSPLLSRAGSMLAPSPSREPSHQRSERKWVSPPNYYASV